jgi:type IV pilus assembly protein PilN
MPRINLLPWRAELRKQRQREFATLAGLTVLAMAGVVALAHFQVESWIDSQNARNAFLDQEIAQLDKKIQEIKDLEKEKENLLARMRIVEQLQTSRPEVVHLFTELVQTLPEGAYLTGMAQKDRTVTLDGLAQSNARVSSLMRNIDASPWLGVPDLKRIQAVATKDAAAQKLSQFQMSVGQTNPNRPESTEQKPKKIGPQQGQKR